MKNELVHHLVLFPIFPFHSTKLWSTLPLPIFLTFHNLVFEGSVNKLNFIGTFPTCIPLRIVFRPSS